MGGGAGRGLNGVLALPLPLLPLLLVSHVSHGGAGRGPAVYPGTRRLQCSKPSTYYRSQQYLHPLPVRGEAPAVPWQLKFTSPIAVEMCGCVLWCESLCYLVELPAPAGAARGCAGAQVGQPVGLSHFHTTQLQ